MTGPPETELRAETQLENNKNYDGIILVSSTTNRQIKCSDVLRSAVSEAQACDAALHTDMAVLPLPQWNTKLVHAPTGPIDADYEDVRVFKRTATAAVKRALRAGLKRPLLVLESGHGNDGFENAELVTLLGALEALYTPLQVREHDPSKLQKVEYLGVYYSEDINKTKQLIQTAKILESGRRVACDIGDCDPERMAPPRIEEYIRQLFCISNIKLDVISDVETIKKQYPLFEAVDRASQERHKGRIIFLEYNPPESVKETLYLVGKGVTYDTGGANVKVGSAMLGMSRDKCGAASVAGFMQVVNLLQPKNIKVVAGLSVVRNSIGSNSYVADEVITARSGARIRIVNTDAEGRMVMADVLCKFKEDALNAVNPHLFTVATLTGHACLAVGEGYSIVMDNGPARKSGHDNRLQKASEKIGDPFEISTIRREDFLAYKGVAEGDDVVQSLAKPSSQCERGHQGPAAFLLMTSGLNKHGSGSDKPLKYSHLDIAASAGALPHPATGSPVLALAQAYLL